MKTIMMNMVRIFNGSKVLVLDKKKKYGWEGLTFPGGKVEPFESFNNSAIREIKEETNLDIKDLEFNGFIQWYCKNPDERYVGLLYTAHGFDGNLVSENIEGNLFFEDYEEFKAMEGHSDLMEYILKIYDGMYKEISLIYDEKNVLIEREFIK